MPHTTYVLLLITCVPRIQLRCYTVCFQRFNSLLQSTKYLELFQQTWPWVQWLTHPPEFNPCYYFAAWLAPPVLLEGNITANQIKVLLSDHLSPMNDETFLSLWDGLCQDDNVPSHTFVWNWWEVLEQCVR